MQKQNQRRKARVGTKLLYVPAQATSFHETAGMTVRPVPSFRIPVQSIIQIVFSIKEPACEQSVAANAQLVTACGD